MPASSFVSKPTRTFGSVCRGSLRSTASSVAGFNLAAQPAAFAIDVSFGHAVDIDIVDGAGKDRVPTTFLVRSLCVFIVKDAPGRIRVTRCFTRLVAWLA